MGHQLAGGHSGWRPELESQTTHLPGRLVRAPPFPPPRRTRLHAREQAVARKQAVSRKQAVISEDAGARAYCFRHKLLVLAPYSRGNVK